MAFSWLAVGVGLHLTVLAFAGMVATASLTAITGHTGNELASAATQARGASTIWLPLHRDFPAIKEYPRGL